MQIMTGMAVEQLLRDVKLPLLARVLLSLLSCGQDLNLHLRFMLWRSWRTQEKDRKGAHERPRESGSLRMSAITLLA